MTLAEALAPVDSALWELGEALQGMRDEELWVRPHPRLLSVGELVTHIAMGEMRWLVPDLESPLRIDTLNYYPVAVGQPLVLPLGVEALQTELRRIHEATKARLFKSPPDLATTLPERNDWTWGYALEYLAFHVAYHTGQIYSARHLMGHDTPDN